MDYKVRFNVPFVAGSEAGYIQDVMRRKHLAGKGFYTQRCQNFFKEQFGFPQVLLTPSCSDALEMSAILADVQPGDEVIIPAFTFVSTANAFALRGAKIVYADSEDEHPNVDPESIRSSITSKTKAVVVVHYGGFGCRIQEIKEICDEHGVLLIEDAACALNSYYDNKELGSFGDLSCFSFHETKNITCGKGGMLVVNNPALQDRALVVWEKGTNRSAFFKGEVDKYGWVDLGSSYLNSELMAAFLWGQLEKLDEVQTKRYSLWNEYDKTINSDIAKATNTAVHNAHMFYVTLPTEHFRDQVIKELANEGIQAVFHYQSLNRSKFSMEHFGAQDCPNAERFEQTILRLPLHMELSKAQVLDISQKFLKITERLKLIEA